ncbi:MAG: biopolymer transporter ExbD [Myxococcota bacterium]
MRRYRSDQEESEVDITPMLDVVFIMLIFFIVTASFVKESGVDVERPSAAPPSDQKKESEDILIALTSNDDIYIDGRAVDVRVVRANIERLRADSPEGQVILQADPDASNGVVVSIIDQAKQAGVDKVSIASTAKR